MTENAQVPVEKVVPVATSSIRVAAAMLETMFEILHEDQPECCGDGADLIVTTGAGQTRNITEHVPIVIRLLRNAAGGEEEFERVVLAQQRDDLRAVCEELLDFARRMALHVHKSDHTKVQAMYDRAAALLGSASGGEE